MAEKITPATAPVGATIRKKAEQILQATAIESWDDSIVIIAQALRDQILECADVAEDALEEHWWRGRVGSAIRDLADLPLSPEKQAVIDSTLSSLDSRAAAAVGIYREGEDIEC